MGIGIPIIGDLIGAAKDIVSEVVVDKDKRDELNARLQELADRTNEREHEQMLAQAEINKVEASHRSIFVAGARPFIMWIGGLGLAMIYIVQPIVQMARGEAVSLDVSELMVLLGGLLGFGGMRSFDKVKGVANDTPLIFTRKKADVIDFAKIAAERKPAPLPEDAPWSK